MTNYNETYTQVSYEIAAATRTGAFFSYGGLTFDTADRTQRIALIDVVTYDYMTEHAAFNQRIISAWEDGGCRGERPALVGVNSALLERLTDAILHEELTDTHPDKVTNTEYPFLSEWQFEVRRNRETSLKMAEEYGSDGCNYSEPKRRRRSRYENWSVDAHAKIRNKERAAQYLRDTKASPVVTYNLAEGGLT